MALDHPSYPNSTIVEAICEIRFAPDPDRQWSDKAPLPLARLIEADFPQLEYAPELNVTIEVKGEVHNAASETVGRRLLFTNGAGNRHLQVSADGNVVVVNFLAPYPGWVAASADIERWWQAASGVLKPQHVIGVGLRYINRIAHEGGRSVGYWLKSSDMLPEALISAGPRSRVYLDIAEDDEHRSRLRVVNMPADEEHSDGSVIFDIERFWQNPAGEKAGSVSEIAARLHESVWSDFSKHLSPNYVQHLEATQGL